MDNSTTVGTNNQVTFTTLKSASCGVTYDLAGNVTSDHVINYVYDQEGRIRAVQNTTTGSKTQYVYDAEGRRVQQGEHEVDQIEQEIAPFLLIGKP